MSKYEWFMVGLAFGLLIAIFVIFSNSNDIVASCNDRGYFEHKGNIVKCGKVIDKNQLIKRNLGEQL